MLSALIIGVKSQAQRYRSRQSFDWLNHKIARMAESVDARDLKSLAERHPGSSPGPGTISPYHGVSSNLTNAINSAYVKRSEKAEATKPVARRLFCGCGWCTIRSTSITLPSSGAGDE